MACAIRAPWKIKDKEVIKQFPFEFLQKVEADDDELSLRISRFSRSIIHLVLTNPARTVPDVHIFALHLKAKLPTRVRGLPKPHQTTIGTAISTVRRTAEAAAVRWIITEHLRANRAAPTAVIGDLNDDPRSNTLALLTEQPALGTSARGRASALYSALQLQQMNSLRDVYYTHEYNNARDVLDHVLVSEAFFAASAEHRWSLRETKIWQDYIDDGQDYSSDPGMLRADFRWG